MSRRIAFPFLVLLLTQFSVAPLGAAAAGPDQTRLFAEGKLGIIGPSLAAGTHASQMCENADTFDCIRDVLGVHSRDWSHAGGEKSWSIASLLGFDQSHIIDVSDDGAEWKDALEQAQQIMLDPQVEAVYIILGGNNVCARQGHNYAGDLDAISGHIDATLLFLTDSLPAGGHIYWSGVVDVTQLRRVMANRDHNYWFEDCQAFWDLNGEKIKDSAAEGICDHFFDNRACQAASVQEEAKDRAMELFLDRLLDRETVEEGPCGKVLSSKSTEQDVEEARQFTLALNALMADKAQEFDGRNGITIHFSNNLYSASARLKPYHVSRLDCFHPNRTGQHLIATEVWRGFNSQIGSSRKVFFDELDNQDYCSQEFTSWETCWTETGREDAGPLAGDVQINLGELRIRDNDKGITRGLDLEGSEETWVSFTYRREELDREADYVSFDVSPDAGQTWVEIDRFQGDADDYSMHRGYYYDISPWATERTMLRLLSSSGLGADDRVYFDNFKVMSWRPPSSGGNAGGVRNDFTGDAQSDIFWRNASDGRNALWQMSGFNVLRAEFLPSLHITWAVAGVCDFDGDAKTDILWRNMTGDNAIWLMDRSDLKKAAWIPSLPPGWQVVGTGDFTASNNCDILWRNSEGNNAIWQMRGVKVVSSAFLAQVSNSWSVVAVNDFNGDKRSDILWRNDSGRNAIWIMDSYNITDASFIASVSTDWYVASTGDFDGDGNSDILWRDTVGRNVIWLMDGTSRKSDGFIPAVPMDWILAATGDYNGDLKTDLLWRKSSGDNAIWILNGLVVKDAQAILALPIDSWTVQ